MKTQLILVLFLCFFGLSLVFASVFYLGGKSELSRYPTREIQQSTILRAIGFWTWVKLNKFHVLSWIFMPYRSVNEPILF